MSDLQDALDREDSPTGQLRIIQARSGLPFGEVLNRCVDLRRRAGAQPDETMADLLASGAVQERELMDAA